LKTVKGIIIVLGAVFVFLQACTLQQDAFHEYVIADAETGLILDSYEYEQASSTLLRVITYGENQQASKTIEFTYDTDGNVSRAIVQNRGIRAIETEVVDYNMTEEFDDENRLVRTIALGDNGDNVETAYFYDDDGKLDSVAQTSADGSVMMMEYEKQ